MNFNEIEKKFIERLKARVAEIGKGYNVNITNNGYIHINGDNHVCMKIKDETIVYVSCGGERIAYSFERDSFDEAISKLESKLLTNEEIDELFRRLLGKITK